MVLLDSHSTELFFQTEPTWLVPYSETIANTVNTHGIENQVDVAEGFIDFNMTIPTVCIHDQHLRTIDS
jgi:hypothetical protein